MNKKDYNQCYYSPTEKHDLCTHQDYCIFDENRVLLEERIKHLSDELAQAINDYNFIREEGTPNCADYEATKMKIKILNEDLKRLEEFKERRIGGKR